MEDNGRKICKNNKEKHNAILESTIERSESQPVLIIAVSTQELLELEEKLRSDKSLEGKRILTFSAASQEDFDEDIDLTDEAISIKYEKTNRGKNFEEIYGCSKEKAIKEYKREYNKFITGESGEKDVITIGTSIVGRGTTIKVSDIAKENGGLHVIVDGLHETSSRNQEQAKWRTARGTDPGSTEAIFSIEDIPKQIRDEILTSEELSKMDIENEEVAENIYQKYYEKIDEKTANAREWTSKFVETTQAVAEQMNQFILDKVKDNPNIGEQEQVISKLTAMLYERAYNIQHRAEGVSTKDRAEKYSEEIEIFAELYKEEALYLLNNENQEYYNPETQEFDEKKWLNDNGYEEIADKYIQFSEEEKRNIFSKYGIIDLVDENGITMSEVNDSVRKTIEMAKINSEKQTEYTQKQTDENEGGRE